jgi:hypothetical protein
MEIRKHLDQALPFFGLALLLGGVTVLAIITEPLLDQARNVAAVNAAKVVTLTNAERTNDGIPQLQRNSLLDQAAQMKAQDMAAKGYYAHVSPDGVTPMYWVDRAGYKYLIIGENLVVNRTEAEQVVDAFMGSPGHKANILRKDFTEIGVGVANGVYKGKDATFTVQIFAAPYPRASNAIPESSKENVKQSSSTPKPVSVPLPAKTQVSPNVPRASSATTTLVARETAPATVANPDSIQEKVKEIIKPLLMPSIATTAPSTSTVSTSTFNVPSVSLDTSVPIELAGVSRLEAELLPVSIGSTWSMELRLFVETVLLGARGLFVR